MKDRRGSGAWARGAGLLALLLVGTCAQAQGRRVERQVETRTEVRGDTTVEITTETTRVTENGRTTTTTRVSTRTVQNGVPAPPGPGVPVVPAAPPAPPAPGGNGTGEAFAPGPGAESAVARESVDAHNRARATQAGANLPPVQWDAALAGRAAAWSRELCGGGARYGGLRHRPPEANGPGENLAMQGSTGDEEYGVREAVAQWMAEERFYDRANNRCSGGQCGHYTQVVWRDSTRVGCGSARCPMGNGFNATVWTCNYAPAGNWEGRRPY